MHATHSMTPDGHWAYVRLNAVNINYIPLDCAEALFFQSIEFIVREAIFQEIDWKICYCSCQAGH